ncbi:5'-methylthioadenosine/S-adenosylhomocysteine nucleosidase [Lacunisphaera limnophila]|uniref:5'-methylthioadenosine/S-adenosylhomocysteine nucleosidase n=1 Tax=Lacunisphaera limnophila TaxID=1838286 RepID=A0A1D8ATT0_9BACT|nr:5'-methylthioadenosine/S-adenosylhomocysteine nucleosidase [Lacunisphaera limnophila]AOS44304.1 5'-methylthioadenosine/S-adenosylhomocysteine nucleosidase [Lacunisphaera limnophila]
MRRSFLPLFVLLVVTLRAAGADILFTAATEAELQPLLAKMTDVRTESRAGWQFWLGTLGPRRVVLTRTEGDPLNAVAATTLAIRRYAPRLVVSYGAARPHDPALQAGDVVLSREFAAFDGMVSPHRDLGTGTAPLTWHPLLHPLMTPGEEETHQAHFPADPAVLAAAQKLTAPRGRLVPGVLGSAHQVNREADRIAYLRTQWRTDTEDGESAHVAGCALLLGVPAFGLRVIDGQPGEAAALVLQLLEVLP